MDIEEYLKQAKEQIRSAKIVKGEKKKKSLIEDCSGYYTLPCSKEPFDGDVIKLSGDEFYLFFQRYSKTPEPQFRDKLDGMDVWFFDKPFRVQKNWLTYITKWMEND